MSKEMINELTEKYYEDYEYICIRVQEEEFSLGEIDHRSKVWVDGEETDEELKGICAIDINKLAHSETQSYHGNHVAIICGDIAEYGADYGELIICDPVVVEILN